MKGILVFNLNNADEKEEFRDMQKAPELISALSEIYTVCRDVRKYDKPAKKAIEEIAGIAGAWNL